MIETGLGITQPLFFIGVVENNVDERLEGRIQVRAFGIHGTKEDLSTTDLPWATMIVPDVNFGPPPVNAFVFGFFIDGRDAQQPFVLGIIPTQLVGPIRPSEMGYGAIPTNYDRLGQSRRPADVGQPTLSRLARGEYTHETNVLVQESGRITNIPVAGSDETFEEPNSAYNAEYPFNRVTETSSGHSIELDDTPGAERIRIFHRSGSFVEIDSRGTTTEKAVSDKYEINDRNMHVYIGGKSIITIEGDSHVLVKGNKVEEVYGDYKQIVHGNHELSVAGQLNLNGSEEVQMRAARVTLESNVEALDMSTAKGINITSGEPMHFKAPEIRFQAEGEMHFKADDMRLQADTALYVKGEAVYVHANATAHVKGEDVKIGGGAGVDINADTVNIDDMVNLAGGNATDPEEAEDASEAEAALVVQLPEPATKSVGGGSSVSPQRNGPSRGTSGYTNVEPSDAPINFTSDCSTDLIQYLKNKETFQRNAYWDHKQWSVGYGMLASGPNDTVTEEEADAALRRRVAQDREYVRQYGETHGYDWNDCQLDALTSFVYNLGTGKMDQLTENGTRDNATIQTKMLEYNKASGVTNGGLVTRRQEESAWFGAGSGNGSGTTEGSMV